MKNLLVFCKSVFLVVSFMILSGFIPITYAQATAEGPDGIGVEGQCKTTVKCGGWFKCTCPDGDCNGCFSANDDTGCGHCHKS